MITVAIHPAPIKNATLDPASQEGSDVLPNWVSRGSEETRSTSTTPKGPQNGPRKPFSKRSGSSGVAASGAETVERESQEPPRIRRAAHEFSWREPRLAARALSAATEPLPSAAPRRNGQ